MTKLEEKTLIGEMFRAIRNQAGENSYIWDIFGPDLETEISRAVDTDTVLPSFRELQSLKETIRKENYDLSLANAEYKKLGEQMKRANQELSADLAKVKSAIADLYQWSKK